MYLFKFDSGFKIYLFEVVMIDEDLDIIILNVKQLSEVLFSGKVIIRLRFRYIWNTDHDFIKHETPFFINQKLFIWTEIILN